MTFADPHAAASRAASGTCCPDAAADGAAAFAPYIETGDRRHTLRFLVDGIHCGHCVWKIEAALAREPGVTAARVNLSTRRLTLTWRGAASDAARLVDTVERLGYRLVAYDPAALDAGARQDERALLRAVAVAGFAAANVMLLSVAVWAGAVQDMGPATRDLMHWISALIALPAVAYSGRPFFRAALAALSRRQLTMEVPISLAVIAAAGMSLFETASGGAHVYFDSACALLFFLLIGRYLDRRALGRARSAAEQLLGLRARAVTVIADDGSERRTAPEQVHVGAVVLVATGERIGVDGTVDGAGGTVDTSLITGEAAPATLAPGAAAHAGMVNLAGPLRLRVTAVGGDTLLAEIVRLTEAAEAERTRYRALADRLASLYAPVVHGLGAASFFGWYLLGGVDWQAALLIAIAVLIVTCPCAFGLAAPMVQAVTSGRLMRRGIIVKSGTALERLAGIDRVVFDKTGTLTCGTPTPDTAGIAPADLDVAAALAAASRHPLAQALARAHGAARPARDVTETPGFGLEGTVAGRRVRLGSRTWCGVPEDNTADGPELWLAGGGRTPVRIPFSDTMRPDAVSAIGRLRGLGLPVMLLSGDRPAAVERVATTLGLDRWQAGCKPDDKVETLSGLSRDGGRLLMVGDGLNDAPALAAAFVSMSPASGADVSQAAADLVFQGERLAPVVETVALARRAARVVVQNFALAFSYNVITVPLAMAGLVSPLIAAVAMSASSLAVVLNALRLGRESAT